MERDVCDFLAESGCLQIIAGAVSNSEDTTVLGNCAAVLANAAARLEFNQKLNISDFGQKVRFWLVSDLYLKHLGFGR